MAKKHIKGLGHEDHRKQIPPSALSQRAEQKYMVWRFDMVDKNGAKCLTI